MVVGIRAVGAVGAVGIALLLAACGGGSTEPPATPASSSAAEQPAAAADTGKALAAQIDAGKTVYKDHCASCHGTKGEGDSGPAIVGKNALPIAPPAGAKMRKTEFKNAADVEAFVKASMPIDAPGSLTDAQAFAVVAWQLHATGTSMGGAALDASTASQIHVH